MNWLKSNKNSTAFALMLLLAAVLTTVFLGGCSTLSDDVKAATSGASLVSSKPELPEPPTKLVSCFKSTSCDEKCAKAKAKDSANHRSKSADAAVLNAIQGEKEKQACGQQLLKWYEEVRAANGAKTPAKS